MEKYDFVKLAILLIGSIVVIKIGISLLKSKRINSATGGFIFVVATTGQRRECCQSSQHKHFDFHTY